MVNNTSEIKFGYSAELKLTLNPKSNLNIDKLLEDLEKGIVTLSFNKQAIIDLEGNTLAKVKQFNSINPYITDCSKYIQ